MIDVPFVAAWWITSDCLHSVLAVVGDAIFILHVTEGMKHGSCALNIRVYQEFSLA